jgi:hypothetical protein
VFCGVFQDRRKEQTEPETGIFYHHKSIDLMGSLEYGVRQYRRIHTWIRDEGFRPVNQHKLIEIKNFSGFDTGKKISQFFRVADVSKGFFLSRVEAVKKTKTGSPLSFQTTITVA